MNGLGQIHRPVMVVRRNRLIDALASCLLGCLIVLVVAMIVLVVRANQAVGQFSQDSHAVLAAAWDTENQINDAARPFAAYSHSWAAKADRWATAVDNQILPDITATMSSVKEAADTSNDASTQSLDLIGSSMLMVDHARNAVDHLAETVDGLAPHAGALLDSGQKLVADSDAIVTGKEFAAFLSGTAQASMNFGAMTKDAHDWLHPRLFPQPYTGRFRTLHKFYTGVKTIKGFAEPTYYGIGVVRGQ